MAPFGLFTAGGGGGGQNVDEATLLHNLFPADEVTGGLFNAEVGNFDVEYKDVYEFPKVLSFREGASQYLRSAVAHTFVNGMHGVSFTFWVNFDADHPTGTRKIIAFGSGNNYIATDGNSLVAKFTFGTEVVTATKTNWVTRGTWQYVNVTVMSSADYLANCSITINDEIVDGTVLAHAEPTAAGILTVASSTMLIGGSAEAATQCYGKIGYLAVHVTTPSEINVYYGPVGIESMDGYKCPRKCRPTFDQYLSADDTELYSYKSFHILPNRGEDVYETYDYPSITTNNKDFNKRLSIPFTSNTLPYGGTVDTHGGTIAVTYGSVVGGLNIYAAIAPSDIDLAGVTFTKAVIPGIRYKISGTATYQAGSAAGKIISGASTAAIAPGAFSTTFIPASTSITIGADSGVADTLVDFLLEDLVISPNPTSSDVGFTSYVATEDATVDFSDTPMDGLVLYNGEHYPVSSIYMLDISRPVSVLLSTRINIYGTSFVKHFAMGDDANPGMNVIVSHDGSQDGQFTVSSTIRGSTWSMLLSGTVAVPVDRILKIGVSFNPVDNTGCLVVNGVAIDTAPLGSATSRDAVFIGEAIEFGSCDSYCNCLSTILEAKLIQMDIPVGKLKTITNNLRG